MTGSTAITPISFATLQSLPMTTGTPQYVKLQRGEALSDKAQIIKSALAISNSNPITSFAAHFTKNGSEGLSVELYSQGGCQFFRFPVQYEIKAGDRTLIVDGYIYTDAEYIEGDDTQNQIALAAAFVSARGQRQSERDTVYDLVGQHRPESTLDTTVTDSAFRTKVVIQEQRESTKLLFKGDVYGKNNQRLCGLKETNTELDLTQGKRGDRGYKIQIVRNGETLKSFASLAKVIDGINLLTTQTPAESSAAADTPDGVADSLAATLASVLSSDQEPDEAFRGQLQSSIETARPHQRARREALLQTFDMRSDIQSANPAVLWLGTRELPANATTGLYLDRRSGKVNILTRVPADENRPESTTSVPIQKTASGYSLQLPTNSSSQPESLRNQADIATLVANTETRHQTEATLVNQTLPGLFDEAESSLRRTNSSTDFSLPTVDNKLNGADFQSPCYLLPEAKANLEKKRERMREFIQLAKSNEHPILYSANTTALAPNTATLMWDGDDIVLAHRMPLAAPNVDSYHTSVTGYDRSKDLTTQLENVANDHAEFIDGEFVAEEGQAIGEIRRKVREVKGKIADAAASDKTAFDDQKMALQQAIDQLDETVRSYTPRLRESVFRQFQAEVNRLHTFIAIHENAITPPSTVTYNRQYLGAASAAEARQTLTTLEDPKTVLYWDRDIGEHRIMTASTVNDRLETHSVPIQFNAEDSERQYSLTIAGTTTKYATVRDAVNAVNPAAFAVESTEGASSGSPELNQGEAILNQYMGNLGTGANMRIQPLKRIGDNPFDSISADDVLKGNETYEKVLIPYRLSGDHYVLAVVDFKKSKIHIHDPRACEQDDGNFTSFNPEGVQQIREELNRYLTENLNRNRLFGFRSPRPWSGDLYAPAPRALYDGDNFDNERLRRVFLDEFRQSMNSTASESSDDE